jgi:hypothetical protein
MSSQTIQIRKYSFSIPAPYAEGQIIGKAEMQALNALFAENIRNNLSRTVTEEIDKLLPGELLEQDTLQHLQEKFTAYGNRYKLPVKAERKKKLGVIETEILQVAEEVLQTRLVREGVKEISQEKKQELLKEISELPDVVKEARKRVGLRQQIAQTAIEELL